MEEKIHGVLSVLGSALPLIIAECCVIIYGLSSWKISFLSARSFLAFLFLFVAITLSLRFVSQLNPAKRRWLPVVIFVLALLSPFLTFLVSPRNIVYTIPSENEPHSINKVILITIDTLRASALSCYGPDGATTPHIDQLAEESVFFDNAIVSAPWTLPSLISIMTGLSPTVHQGTRVISQLPENLPTLADIMWNNGYHTSAIGFNRFLHHGLSKGFIESDFYPKDTFPFFSFLTLQHFFPSTTPDHMMKDKNVTEKLTQLAISWLQVNTDKNFFFWLHYFDPHTPYSPPRQYLKGLTPEPRIGWSFSGNPEVPDGKYNTTVTVPEMEWIKTLYHAEVEYVDDNIGELIAELKRLGIYDESLIILTSDHGEEFWEHNDYGHHHSLYNETMWVPLLIKLPQSAVKHHVKSRIAVQCLFLSILELCGISYESDDPNIQPLPPFWEQLNDPPEVKPIISEGHHERQDSVSVTSDELKYIRASLTGREILLDLENDPAELYPLRIAESDEIDRLRKILEDHLTVSKQIREKYNVQGGSEKELNDTQKQELRALGYIQ